MDGVFLCNVSMPIQLKQELKHVSKVVNLGSILSGNDNDWMAWWYCGILKNRQADSQPNVLVAFRELSDSGSLSDTVIYRRVPLTALGQVRVGTVWRDGLCQSEAVLDCEKFAVDFTKGSWKLTSFQQTAEDRASPPYPQELHPLKHDKDRNWLLGFKLPSGGKLIVPCLEFFTRCYGRSAELRRVLATYPWNECQEERLYAPLDEPEESGKWKVKLRKRMVNGDVIFLAHAKYEPYAENAAKSIYGQIEAQYDPADRTLAFIKVAPWFRGPAELKAKGIWFDEGRSFLALNIVGCSQPTGVSILRGRENANNAEQPANGSTPQSAWDGTPERVLVKPPDIVDLTGDVEPDPHAVSVEIEDPAFEELGEKRVVIDMRKERAQSSSGTKVKGTDASAYSSGEAHGSGQGVGYASIHARPVMESQGVVRDMWNALLYLKKKQPSVIQSVEWFTSDGGYSQEPEPRLMGLQPFEQKDEVDGATRKWPYMDAATLQEIRGVLVARVVANNKSVHIVEIQRRPQKKWDKNGKPEDREEHLKGLAFVLDAQDDFEEWLQQLLLGIRHVKGVVKKLVGRCPGKAAAFKHSPAGSDKVPCETTVLNALEKMGVETHRE